MTDIQIKSAVEIAVELLRDNPELKYFQAIEMAKEMIEDEKERIC